ncbi:MAG: hypothetical protein IBX64_11200, partial [Actinobacteria bacterium]|nr:hypothetical protein [Actinomycetota bacterium]
TLTPDKTATTRYKWDDGTETTYTAPFMAPEGVHTLFFYSKDAAGNTEVTRTKQFKVDTSIPTTPLLNAVDTITASNVATVMVSGTADPNTTVHITASDGVCEVTSSVTSTGSFATQLNLTGLSDGTITITAYAKDEAGNESPVSLAKQVTKEARSFYTDFSKYPANQAPSGWTPRWVTSNVTNLIKEKAGTAGGKCLEQKPTTGSRRSISWDAAGSVSDVETVARLRTDTDTIASHQGWVVVRGSGASATENGYVVSIYNSSNNTKSILLYRYLDGTYQLLQSKPYDWSANTWYWARLRAIGSTIQAKVWPDGENEPSSWSLNATDTSIVSGWVGVGGYARGTKDFDVVGIAKGGATAPITSVPPTTSITVNPSAPDGENGWYKTFPTITLTPDEAATTYYRWDNGVESIYTAPITAPEGIRTLYFYSKDAAGNTEAVRSKQFKVDTPPNTPVLSEVDTITLTNVEAYQVHGTADPDTTVYVTVSDGVHEATAAASSTGAFTATLNLTTLSDGTITITSYAEDETGNTSPVSLAKQTTKDTIHLVTNFSEYVADQEPTGWTERWYTMYTTNLIKAKPDTEGGKCLEHKTTNSARRSLSWDVVGNISDVEIVAKVRTDTETADTHQNTLLVRGSGKFTSESGYAVTLHNSSTDGKGIVFIKHVNGTARWIRRNSYDWSTNTWYWVRLRAVGQTIQIKAWPDGDSEPSSWLISYTDVQALPAGWVGIGGYYAGTEDYDVVGIAKGGAIAPTR